jgi:hypothetical protein
MTRKLNFGNGCYYSAENPLSCLLLKNINLEIYKTIILPMVFCGCEIWSLTLMEEGRMRVLRMLGLRRNEATAEWRKLHNEELCDVYSLPSIITMIKSRRMKWAVRKAEEKSPLGRPRHRWVCDIKMDLEEVGWGDVDWIGLAYGRHK